MPTRKFRDVECAVELIEGEPVSVEFEGELFYSRDSLARRLRERKEWREVVNEIAPMLEAELGFAPEPLLFDLLYVAAAEARLDGDEWKSGRLMTLFRDTVSQVGCPWRTADFMFAKEADLCDFEDEFVDARENYAQLMRLRKIFEVDPFGGCEDEVEFHH